MSDIYQPLHLKYRPTTFDEFMGNKAMVKALRNTISKRGKPHSYLFHGPSGCGKTTLARMVASEMGCSERDLHELNSASYRGIDSVRDLISKTGLHPWEGDITVYILDEVHMLTREAQNALLKVLEEPPAHCYFILCTTEPDKLLKTIRTRCAQFVVVALGRKQILTRLKQVYDNELLDGSDAHDMQLDPDLGMEIVRAAKGSMRSALMILDQVIDIEDVDEAIAAVQEATGEDAQVIELCRVLAKTPNWGKVAPILATVQGEPESIRYAVLGYFHTVAIKAEDPWQAMVIMTCFNASVMYSGRAGLATACWDAINHISDVNDL